MVDPANHLILTVDYELFGDGSGGVEGCVVAPTEVILNTAERHGAPVTLFVEALEFAAMARTAQSEGHQLRGDVTQAERQVAQARQRGHDIQLHLHPQWLDARRDEGGRWRLDFGQWRMGDLPPQRVTQALEEGLAALGSMTGGAVPHRPVAFRAGAWCVQPSSHVLAALVDHGFRADSSVAPGLHHPARGDWYDFRGAPATRPCWPVAGDVCLPEPGALWEVPIAVAPVPWLGHVTRKAAARILRRQGLPAGCAGSYAGPNGRGQAWRGKLARLRSAGRAMLDFSTLDAQQLIAIVEGWRRRRPADGLPLPIVAIAHSKNFTARSAAQLDTFLDWAEGQPQLEFSTFPRWLDAAGPPRLAPEGA